MGWGGFGVLVTKTHNPSPDRGGSRGTRSWTLRWVPCPHPRHLGRVGSESWPGSGAGPAGREGPGEEAGRPGASGLRVRLPPPPPQKIMHTRKRHQDMFQDLSRRLQHAEKDKEALAPESKVCGSGALARGLGGELGRPWAGGRAAERAGS